MRGRSRERTHSVKCAELSCVDSTFYVYRTREDYVSVLRAAQDWRCVRHSHPHELLTPSQPRIVKVVTSERAPDVRVGLFWDKRNGFIHGPGFRCFASDFPEGTRVRITVEVLESAASDPARVQSEDVSPEIGSATP